MHFKPICSAGNTEVGRDRCSQSKSWGGEWLSNSDFVNLVNVFYRLLLSVLKKLKYSFFFFFFFTTSNPVERSVLFINLSSVRCLPAALRPCSEDDAFKSLVELD